MNTSRPLTTVLGLALLGSLPVVADAQPSFTSSALNVGVMLAAAGAEKSAGAEGACGEGACGEGMCAASMKPQTTPPAENTSTDTGNPDASAKGKHGAEGKCGEGKCGKM